MNPFRWYEERRRRQIRETARELLQEQERQRAEQQAAAEAARRETMERFRAEHGPYPPLSMALQVAGSQPVPPPGSARWLAVAVDERNRQVGWLALTMGPGGQLLANDYWSLYQNRRLTRGGAREA